MTQNKNNSTIRKPGIKYNKDREYILKKNKQKPDVEEIEDNEKLYLSLFNEIHYGLALHEVIYDENKNPVDFKLLDVNPAYEKIVNMDRKNIIGKKASEILPKIDKGWMKKLSNVALTGKSIHSEDFFPGLDKYYDVMIFSPKKMHFAILMTDITERKTTEKKLQQQYKEIQFQNEKLAVSNEEFESVNKELLYAHTELVKSKEKYQILYNNALAAMVSMNVETGTIIEANDLAYKMFGYSSKEEIIGKQNGFERFADPELRIKFHEELLAEGELYNIEAELIRNDGSTFWGEITCKLYPEDKIVEGIFLDVTRRKAAEEKIARLTFYDRLTELPNKGMLKNIIYEEIEKSNEFALICLGVDKFKVINNLFGPETGDHLLKQIASRLNDMYFKKDFVSRFEGDKFMIILMDIANIDRNIVIEDIEKIIQKTLKAFSAPIIINNYTLDIRSSIGVSLYPTDGDNPDSLMRNSESAMNVAKQRGGNAWHFFDAKLNEQMMNRFKLENELKAAINHNEFEAFYQPKVNKEGDIIGAEALVRWYSPRRGGYILPFEFIPVVEKNGMIVDIGYSILKKTCEQNKKWRDMGLMQIPISVNLSPYQFKQKDLITNIRNIIFETGMDPKWLELEITESGIMENEGDAIEKLNEIHSLGISISIDDFGTGYSSLSKLKTYPVDVLKIDKTFIDDLPNDNMSATIATTIISLAHNLGFRVVAEGVEKIEQLNFLTKNKCDQFQGYYFYKPIPPDELEKHLIKIKS